MKSRFLILFVIVSLSSLTHAATSPFAVNKLLGRGINLGNALDAPEEGHWGVTLQEDYFKIIAEAGFDSVRVPIRWSSHAIEQAPFTIDDEFFERIEWVIDNSLKNELSVVINIHHYDEIFKHPQDHEERFVALWKQIATRFKDLPDNVIFELLNEPNDKLTAEVWNKMLLNALKEVRKTNPNRTIMIGPASWNSYKLLPKLELPKEDRNIIVTFHYYDPFNFTHQGATWVGDLDAQSWLGTKWTASEKEVQIIKDDFKIVSDWATEHNRPIYIGEFGSFGKADMQSRILHAKSIRDIAEDNNFSWAWWEFCSGFGAWDSATKQWRKEIKDALIKD